MPKTTFTVKKEQLQVVIDRVFEATPEQIFKIMSDPTLSGLPGWQRKDKIALSLKIIVCPK